MTAEVAVLNRFAIAMAADSAITVDAFHNNALRTKVYNSGNKLFTLSKYRPVGLMYYNGVTLGGIPWETLVKEFRRKIGKGSHERLEQYGQDFFSWLTDNALFDEKDSAQILANTFLRQFLRLSQMTEQNTESDVNEFLDQQISRLRNLEDVSGYTQSFVSEMLAKYNEQLLLAKKSLFSENIIDACDEKLTEFTKLSLMKKAELDGYSGIVIAGFGEKEGLPQLLHYFVDVVIDGRPRYWMISKTAISEANPSSVHPLADAEAINTLLTGINPRFSNMSIQAVSEVLKGLPQTILGNINELSPAQRKSYEFQFAPVVDGLVKNVTEALQNFQFEEYIRPIKGAIASLQASDLGVVAETLLGAAQILKRVNPDIETVGGPVDVAVITKGDGFVWIKRKHYFDSKLNHAFVARYLEE